MPMPTVVDLKVLIHFGFPKTGSSTLQYGLFKPLHDRGILNLKTWRQEDSTEHLDRRPSSCLFAGGKILPEYLDFSENRLNILSDESFTAPIKLRQNNYGNEICDPFSFPQKIKEQIVARYGGQIEFIPMIVIRNQPQLIFSQYVEEYNLKKYKGVDLIFDESNNICIEGFEIYQFAKYIDILENVFGQGKVEVFLFEEWTRDLQSFCEKQSRIIDVDTATIAGLLSKSHENKKHKASGGYFTKDGETLIPHLNDTQISGIQTFFEKDNSQLKRFIDEARLIKFGYL
ncbi:hypothetical protein [Roseibium polysiphoniae]|uniref:Sulfotransferase domain-containing protein n=1 Tax=Roseibium polysiphoniae TaxID=2571221 RepID=A0ABR9C9T9_9HYPH|nr:hypothetical protein [Roseibium polysiphoniae]MBD8876655.1 hypothetical protein [Roseibium polysiphoniae]